MKEVALLKICLSFVQQHIDFYNKSSSEEDYQSKFNDFLSSFYCDNPSLADMKVTLLHMAAYVSNVQDQDYFDDSRPDMYGMTPLHYALRGKGVTMECQYNTVRKLVDKHPTLVDIKDNESRSPLDIFTLKWDEIHISLPNGYLLMPYNIVISKVKLPEIQEILGHTAELKLKDVPKKVALQSPKGEEIPRGFLPPDIGHSVLSKSLEAILTPKKSPSPDGQLETPSLSFMKTKAL